MENKEIATTKKITQELIGGWILWGLVLGIAYSFAFSLITSFIKSMILQALITIIMQGFVAFFVWKLSTQSTFKKRTMSYDGVPTVMRNLIIFTIIICVVNGIYNFIRINGVIDEAVKSNYKLQYTEKMMSYLYSSDQMAEYNKQKEEAIAKVKNQAHIYLVIVEIGLTAVYLAVLPLEKKEILKYVNQEENINL